MLDLLLPPLSIAAGCALLYVGGEMLVSSSTFIADRMGMSAVAIGATVVAIGTSAPEFSVSFGAALAGHTDVSVGNVVGSNVCNIILVLGLCALFRPLQASRQVLTIHFPVLIGISAAFTWMIRDQTISRPEGALFAVALVVYVLWNLRRAEEDKETRDYLASEVAEALGEAEPPSMRGPVLRALVGIFLLALGAKWLVEGALHALEPLHLSEAAIGLTVIAVGTSLPEIGTSIIAARRGQGDLAVGNAIGSSVFNLLGVLGFTACVRPLQARDVSLMDGFVLIAVSTAGLVLLARPQGIRRLQGSMLVATYVLYLAAAIRIQP